MKKDTAYYGIATIIHSLIKQGQSKAVIKREVNKIIDEMYKEFKK